MTRFPPPRDPVSPASIFTVTRSGSPRTVLESSRVLWQVEGLTLMGPCRDLQQCSGPLKVRMRNVQVCWSLRPQSKPPLSQPGGWRRGEEEDRGRAGEEISVLAPPLQAPRCIHSAPASEKSPVGEPRWVDREGTATATWEPTRRRAEKEGKKAGGREQGREAGGREEERGRREGGTEERRSNKEPRSWGWQRVQGRGGRSRGSGGTWGRGRGLGGRIVQPAPDLPGVEWG